LAEGSIVERAPLDLEPCLRKDEIVAHSVTASLANGEKLGVTLRE
jgi:hypothetical protein